MLTRSVLTVALPAALAILYGISLSLAPTALAQEPLVKITINILGGGNPDGTLWLDPDEVPIASVPVLVNVTFYNVDDVNPGMLHNFRAEIADVAYETALIPPGENSSVEFWINETGEIPYWCNVPGHRQLGMEGTFIVGQLAAEEEGPGGIALRAYWIGLIGIFSMLAVVVLSYFVIKSESRHHTDHRDHRRRGLP